MKTTVSKLVLGMLAGALCFGQAGSAHAQSKGTVVICPAVFENAGIPAARTEAINAIKTDLQGAGYKVESYQEGQNMWDTLALPQLTANEQGNRNELIRFGRAMNARYVIEPTFDVHTSSRWFGLSRRTVSTATVSIKIVNVPEGQTVYSTTETYDRSKTRSVVDNVPSKTTREDHAIDTAVNRALSGFISRIS